MILKISVRTIEKEENEVIDEVFAFTAINIDAKGFAHDIFDRLEGDERSHFSITNSLDDAITSVAAETQEMKRAHDEDGV